MQTIGDFFRALPADVLSLNDKHATAARAGDVKQSRMLAHITTMRLQRFMRGNYYRSATLKHAMRHAWNSPDLIATTTRALLGDDEALDVLEFRNAIDGIDVVAVLACSFDDRERIANIVDSLSHLPNSVPDDDAGELAADDFVYRDSISRNAP